MKNGMGSNNVFGFTFLIAWTMSVTGFAVEDRAVDDAIVSALRYLASQQNPNGSWTIDVSGESTAATSLSVMAFLAAGHVPDEGPYGRIIDRGVDYVLTHQEANGLIVDRRGHGPMYDHGISALMLSEVAGMTSKEKSARVRQVLEIGVRLILKAQQVRKVRRESGGWRYQPNSEDSDLSVTGWQLLALRAAKDIGCDVPIERIDLAVGYVKKCSTGRGFGYQPGNGATSTLTAAGVLCLQVCDHFEDKEVEGGIQFLQRQPLRFDQEWYYYGVYYLAISGYKYGGPEWERTKAILFQDLIANQQPIGNWEARNSNERGQGRVYATSLSVLALTVEYGYLPIYQR
jgi:hypothetical protein